MTPAQQRTHDDLITNWAKANHTDVKTYKARDSKDILLVADGERPIAARINTLGSCKVGPVDGPGLGGPLKPLSPDHPNYEWEQQQAAVT